jgi:hypothetical protein
MRGIILEVLQRVGAAMLPGGFHVDERGKLSECYAEGNAWQDELGNPLSNYNGENAQEMEERHRGNESEEHKDAVSAGYLRDTAQRGGA